ncbi:unnamed protein product [Peronospora farinosa]|uniref:HTH CENPB-type domain-containing protein n=1 Tax=Peronospora farinosa TaxID=134698 RepID=A0AAV0T4A2_9STRA|nr:unnamed protein product [Peronospora farinosa]CAI5712213.1 unnamed protein product [Peronospora farinosa]
MSFSNGWLGGFKKRYNIRLGNAAAASAMDTMSGVTLTSTIHSIEQLQSAARMYDPRDVYCMQETGLLYELSPEKPAGRGRAARKENCEERLTIVFAVNADASDRMEPMFIGQGKVPQLIEELDADSRHFYYQNNKRAWMTPVMFQDYISAVDTRMRDEGRYILLLVSPAPSHVSLGLELTNVRLEFLPLSMMEPLSMAMQVAMPVNAGIIAAFKRRYRRYHMLYALDRFEAGRQDVFHVEQLQAMRWARHCWKQELPEEIIRKCWAATEILVPKPNPETLAAFESVEEDIDKEICDTVSALDILRPLPIDEFVSPRDENAGIHCAGLEETDFMFTVPDNTGFDSKLNVKRVPPSVMDAARQQGVAPTELTPRLQELHARIEASASSASTLGLAHSMHAVHSGEVSASVLTSSTGVEDVLGLSTPSSVGKPVDGPATNEQLIECFKVLLPELDRLRFDDHTKKSIRTTFRKLKETAEQQALDRKRGTMKKAEPHQHYQPQMQPSSQEQQAQVLQIQQLQQQQIQQMQQQLLMQPDVAMAMTTQTSQIGENTVL